MLRSGFEFVIVIIGLIYPLILSTVLHWAAVDGVDGWTRFAAAKFYLMAPEIVSLLMFMKASTLNAMQIRTIVTSMFGSSTAIQLNGIDKSQRFDLAIQLDNANIRSSGRVFAATAIVAIATLGVVYGFRLVPLPNSALGWSGGIIGVLLTMFAIWRTTAVNIFLHDNPYLSHSEVMMLINEARQQVSAPPL